VAQGGREQGAERGSDEDVAAASTSDVTRPVVAQQIMQTSSADLKKRTKTVRVDANLLQRFYSQSTFSNGPVIRVEAVKLDATSCPISSVSLLLGAYPIL